jgi:hypothetical protein
LSAWFLEQDLCFFLVVFVFVAATEQTAQQVLRALENTFGSAFYSVRDIFGYVLGFLERIACDVCGFACQVFGDIFGLTSGFASFAQQVASDFFGLPCHLSSFACQVTGNIFGFIDCTCGGFACRVGCTCGCAGYCPCNACCGAGSSSCDIAGSIYGFIGGIFDFVGHGDLLVRWLNSSGFAKLSTLYDFKP